MYFVYALDSQTRQYIYVGMTDNPERRINSHQSGYNRTTKPYRPFNVLTVEEFPSRVEARAREKYLKSGSGKEYLKALLSKRPA